MATTQPINTSSPTNQADLSEQTLGLFTFICYVILSGTISFIGIIFNIVAMTVFVKMGFTETTNVSLLSLTVVDTGVLTMMLGYSVLYNPLLMQAVDSMDLIKALDYLVIGWPLLCLSRTSGCLTAFISLERFLCVVMPLKVKSVLTPRRAVYVAAGIFTAMVSGTLPGLCASSIEQAIDPLTNRSIHRLYYRERGYFLDDLSLSFNVFTQMTSFAAVTVFTVGLIFEFLRKIRWRNSVSRSFNYISISKRDRKLVKMIILVSVVFIACSLPSVVGSVVMFVVEDFSFSGRLKNLFMGTFSTFFILGSINCSVNIFIYSHMSSKFRKTLLLMFTLTSASSKLRVG